MTIQLGLIGENISKSRAPRLHPLLGRLCGLDVTYTPFDSEGVPGFDPMATLQARMDEGFKGLNVTHPYKTVVAAALPNLRPRVRRLGSINTVVFVDGQWIGANTDHSGTIRGYRHVFGTLPAGRVLMMGAGGVSRAIAFALQDLGVVEILIHDLDDARAHTLTQVLSDHGCAARTVAAEDLRAAAAQADGLVNATPMGMYKHPGMPLPADAIGGQRWAFDAVYTPLWTDFLRCCQDRGLAVMTGFELFLFQGLDAFRCFTGITVDEDEVRDEVASWMAD
ncbi:MAG: shikimate dehydrogenase [Rhodobacterales bacterium]|nr:shikimate dehydrogenase [Rhodobacterales bacterium]